MTTDIETKPCALPTALFDRLVSVASELSLRVQPADNHDVEELLGWVRFQLEEQKSEELGEIEDRFQEFQDELDHIEACWIEDQFEDGEEMAHASMNGDVQ